MRIEISVLKDFLTYDPETGYFSWIKSVHPKQVVGDIAGAINSQGYVVLSINKQFVLAHRAAWAITYGQWPVIIDHINMNKSDNRLVNLRSVTRRTNQENRQISQSNSSTKLLGAFTWKHKYRSQIKAKGVLYNLGLFDTAEEAHEAYLKAKRQLHEGNTL